MTVNSTQLSFSRVPAAQGIAMKWAAMIGQMERQRVQNLEGWMAILGNLYCQQYRQYPRVVYTVRGALQDGVWGIKSVVECVWSVRVWSYNKELSSRWRLK